MKLSKSLEHNSPGKIVHTIQIWKLCGQLDRYSRKLIVCTIKQRSYDMRRSHDTIYSQNVSQAIIVSYRYDTTSVLLATLMFYISIEKLPLGMHQNTSF